jgi:hypothetical protein
MTQKTNHSNALPMRVNSPSSLPSAETDMPTKTRLFISSHTGNSDKTEPLTSEFLLAIVEDDSSVLVISKKMT